MVFVIMIHYIHWLLQPYSLQIPAHFAYVIANYLLDDLSTYEIQFESY